MPTHKEEGGGNREVNVCDREGRLAKTHGQRKKGDPQRKNMNTEDAKEHPGVEDFVGRWGKVLPWRKEGREGGKKKKGKQHCRYKTERRGEVLRVSIRGEWTGTGKKRPKKGETKKIKVGENHYEHRKKLVSPVNRRRNSSV